jgi:hypothetical protein
VTPKPVQCGFLTHYPTNGPLIHNGNSWIPEAIITGGNNKRFSDAELAAEYYAAFFDLALEFTRYGNAEPSQVLERFATHPHYDES